MDQQEGIQEKLNTNKDGSAGILDERSNGPGPVLLLITEKSKEEELLKMFFEDASFNVITSKPTYSNYIKSLQYNPAVILIEMPATYSSSINFTRLVRKNRRTAKTPIIAFGNFSDEANKQSFYLNGVSYYTQRPLKTGKLLGDINRLLAQFGKGFIPGKQKKALNRNKDMEAILDKGKPSAERIDIMAKYVGNMMAFPFTVAKVLSITQSADTGAADLAKAIQADPVITAVIFKVANSVLFASRDHRISEIKEAIVRIGFLETKNITMGLAVLKIFSKKERSAGFDRVEFWYHSLGCAVIAEKIAKNAGYPRPNEAFVAGLLHDFGIVILDEFFADIFSSTMEKTTKYGTSFTAQEDDLLGMNHKDMAEKLFESWNLPFEVTYSMKNHSQYASLKDSVGNELRILTMAVGMANSVAKCMQIGRGCDLFIDPIPNALLYEMKYPAGLRDLFFDEIFAQINLYNTFLSIDSRSFPYPGDRISSAEKIRIALKDRESYLLNPINCYLKTQGYTLVGIESSLDIERLNPPADLAIIHARKTDTMEDLDDFTKIMKSSKEKELNPLNPVYLPVLLALDSEMEMHINKAKRHVAKTSNSIDLRHMDQKIDNLVSGNQANEEIGLDISIKSIDNDIEVVSVAGSISVENMLPLKDLFTKMLGEDTKHIAVDLKDVDFMASCGIGLLINLHKRLSQQKRKACLVSPNKRVQSVLATTNLTKVFSIADKEEDILKTLAS